MANKLAQIHFNIPTRQKNTVHQLAQHFDMSDSDFYRKMINKQIINEEANLADQELGQIIHSGKLPKIQSNQEFKEWLAKND